MTNSIFDRAPKAPSVFISPRFFSILFLSLNLHISEVEAEEFSKKFVNGEDFNFNFSSDLNIDTKKMQDSLDRLIKRSSQEQLGKIKIKIGDIDIEIKDLNISSFKTSNTNLTLTLPTTSMYMPKECSVFLDFRVGAAANDNHIDTGRLKCRFRF